MGRNIFTRGEFDRYKVVSLNEAKNDIVELYHGYAQEKIPVFISHKHDDLEELKGLIGFLESEYNVKAYIDSRDGSMPLKTSGETALKIKERIMQCKKFILLATDAAIESKWCNWELGFGDTHKFKSNSIALFPVKERYSSDEEFKGNEYMGIYPYIVYRKGDRYKSGEAISDGYYVRYKENDEYYLTPLREWLYRSWWYIRDV